MIKFNGINIENLFNIGKKDIEEKNGKPMLAYGIKNFGCVIPADTNFTYQNDLYKVDVLKNFLNALKSNYSRDKMALKGLNVYQIEIINVGTKPIFGNSFFDNSPLRIYNCEFYVGYIDNKSTKQYINAQVIKYEDYNYFISFDCLKPNDSIYVYLLSDRSYCDTNTVVLGETEFFEKPICVNELREQYNKRNKSNILKSLLLFILITSFIFFAILGLSKLAKINPVLKINFSYETIK